MTLSQIFRNSESTILGRGAKYHPKLITAVSEFSVQTNCRWVLESKELV
ncbi:hypothetical protein AVDCRST_MAG92-3952 [uncultured Coleofasciculus sp.]|uniref:Uncharacterized protein n=1 Tax=uncultured Coleofasciculus sp. TaxID=1267456 RepID=A0A6J4JSC7_9CYAN|nr:hypothetical protein AVDCRST_MAG92-3952 [uncultured Coleofasciculus sp.]